MHEFVIFRKIKKGKGSFRIDFQGLVDYGMHPPTMYFPLIVHEALMVEPTETETKETLDEAIEIYQKIYNQALLNPEELHQSPISTVIGRPDEVTAARNPILRYPFDE